MREEIVIQEKKVTYRSRVYALNGYEVIDETCVHLFLDEGVYAITIPCIVNNVNINTTDELIAQL